MIDTSEMSVKQVSQLFEERTTELNARLAEKLTEKGVEANETETVTALIDKVDDIKQGDPQDGIKMWLRNVTNTGVLDGDELTEIGDIDLSVATTLRIGYNSTKLKSVGNINAPVLTTADSAFRGSTALKSVGVLTAPELINATAMFYGNSSVEKFGGLVDAKPSNVDQMFFGVLQLVEVTEPLDVSAAPPKHMAHNFIHNAINLERIWFVEESIGFGFTLATCGKNIEVDCLKSVIRGLKNYAGTENEFVYTLGLSAVHKQKLEAEGATAPNGMTWLEYVDAKGWNV